MVEYFRGEMNGQKKTHSGSQQGNHKLLPDKSLKNKKLTSTTSNDMKTFNSKRNLLNGETLQLSGSSNFLLKVHNIHRKLPVNPFENPSFLLQATYALYTCHFHEDRYLHSFLKRKKKGKVETN